MVHLPSPALQGEDVVLGAAGAMHYSLTHEASRLGQVPGSPGPNDVRAHNPVYSQSKAHWDASSLLGPAI